MSLLPPGLLYLVIYNPNLKPAHDVSPDDEDAEEQAHILFYTAREHAVSRDRMLRQVGLAKALLNFSAMFGSMRPCDTVHSQTRRMIMVTPEPGYWIHACVELAKVARQPDKVPDKSKGKGKGKQPPAMYDYQQGSVRDAALRAQLIRGYNAFKISHGSFHTIMSTRGKEALELQLERFFTVWAWSWDFETRPPFSDHLGTPVHPLSNHLLSLIDAVHCHIPQKTIPLVLSPPHVIASKVPERRYPPSLPAHLLALAAPPKPPPTQHVANTLTGSKHAPSENNAAPANVITLPTGSRSVKSNGAMGFIAMPPMDIRKWNWPTFGIGGNGHAKRSPDGDAVKDVEQDEMHGGPSAVTDKQAAPASLGNGDGENHVEVTVDPKVLEDALSDRSPTRSASVATTSSLESSLAPSTVPTPSGDGSPPKGVVTTVELGAAKACEMLLEHSNSMSVTITAPPTERIASTRVEADPTTEPQLPPPPLSTMTNERQEPEAVTPQQPPACFLDTWAHLPLGDSLNTRRIRIRYMKQHGLLFALVPLVEADEQPVDLEVEDETLLTEKATTLLTDLRNVIDVEERKIAETFSSVKNVLQKSQYIIATPDLSTHSSLAFSPSSGHLHDEERTLESCVSRDSASLRTALTHLNDSDADVQEVFSRGQNPQDWYLAKRGLGTGPGRDGVSMEGTVYMQIERKEASLTDVDNELAGVVRRFVELI